MRALHPLHLRRVDYLGSTHSYLSVQVDPYDGFGPWLQLPHVRLDCYSVGSRHFELHLRWATLKQRGYLVGLRRMMLLERCLLGSKEKWTSQSGLNSIQILHHMSRYRTPLNIEPTPKSFESTGKKFRLPFAKDEPSEEKDFSISEENSSFVIRSQIKEREGSKTAYEPTHSFVGIQNKQKAVDSMPEAEPESQMQTMTVVDKKKAESQIDSDKTQGRLYGYRSHNVKAKRRYINSSRFEEDEDSQTQQKVYSKKAAKLPVIGENRNSQWSDDEAHPKNIWHSFSRGLEEYKQEQERKKGEKKEKLPRQMKSRARRSESRIEKEKEQKLAYQNETRNLKAQSIRKPSSRPKQVKQSQQQLNRLPESAQNPLAFVESLRQMVAPYSRKGKRTPVDFYLDCFQQIKLINPFFRKAGQLGGCILLSMGKLSMVDIGRPAYTQGAQLKHISIILYGRFLLSNKYNTFRKVALTGETLSQEEIFEGGGLDAMKQGRQSYHREEARALSRSCLLKISLNRYFRMQKELNRTAYRHIAHTIDSLFKINYLEKQTHGRQQNRDRLVTEPAPPSRIRKSRQFFH